MAGTSERRSGNGREAADDQNTPATINNNIRQPKQTATEATAYKDSKLKRTNKKNSIFWGKTTGQVDTVPKYLGKMDYA